MTSSTTPYQPETITSPTPLELVAAITDDVAAIRAAVEAAGGIVTGKIHEALYDLDEELSAIRDEMGI